MSPRCEVALIIALLGLSSGIITQDIYFMAVVVAVLSTLVTPPLLKMMFKGQRKTMKKRELILNLSSSKGKSLRDKK
jgi:Kef-type K+ transport system membrane component KefB